MPPGVLAMHWRLVPGQEAAQRTIVNARLAGDAARRDLDPVAADAWYDVALSASRQGQDALVQGHAARQGVRTPVVRLHRAPSRAARGEPVAHPSAST